MVTTRERVKDLAAFEGSTAPRRYLGRLSTPGGVEHLETLDVHGTAAELERLVEDVRGHALTLSLLSGFLLAAGTPPAPCSSPSPRSSAAALAARRPRRQRLADLASASSSTR